MHSSRVKAIRWVACIFVCSAELLLRCMLLKPCNRNMQTGLLLALTREPAVGDRVLP